jgi:protease-4
LLSAYLDNIKCRGGEALARGGKRAILALAIIMAGSVRPPAWADSSQPLPLYPFESSLLATTPSADEGALGATFNPAQWGVIQSAETDFWWSDRDVRPKALDNWGFAIGKRVGFSARRHDFVDPSGLLGVTDYQLGVGSGKAGHYAGIAYGWSGGDNKAVGREDFLTLGSISRPSRWLSFGTIIRHALGDPAREGVIDLGVRPLGSARALLFADYSVRRGQKWTEGNPSGGIALRPVQGLQAAFKLRERGSFQFSVGVSLNRAGAQVIPSYDSEGDHQFTNYVVRVNPPLRGADLDARLNSHQRFLEMAWKGAVTYQKPRYGDDGSLPLRNLTARIEFAEKDPTVAGVAVNLSGFRANPAMAWELREKLLTLRRAGKKAVLYGDRLDLTTFYLASAADRIVMDPEGEMLVPGLQLSRTYWKELLAKIGVGFDEWRFLKYKSAMETYSRDRMSEADREQRQALIDDFYEEFADGLVASGRTTRAGLDSVVNEQPLLLAAELRARGWVDAIGRWEDVKQVCKSVNGDHAVLRSHRYLREIRRAPDEAWGPEPQIALVYAVGECAMDTGIRGRATSEALRGFRKNGDVKAVVLRADSPGGDVLPSDLVAHELQELRKSHKPIRVSQGRVAASGGYWISMDAESIATTPFTITGSIGVIGGWFWNEGLGKKLGLTSDRVQVGRSADLLGGVTLPLVGVTVPERNLTPKERDLAKHTILALYADFTSRVAQARKLDPAYVAQIAEGHVYTGREGIRKKIVDRFATLDETIEAAKRSAGISPDRKVTVVEFPTPPLFRWPRLLPNLPGIRTVSRDPGEETAPVSLARILGVDNYEARELDFLLHNPGRPLLLIPGSILPNEEPMRF